MMGKHILKLSFPDCTDESVFLIDDISQYDGLAAGISGSTSTGLPVVCANLQITPPGFFHPTSLSVVPQSRMILNACQLGIAASTQCVSNCPNMDDGLYNVRYSVSPNDQVYVEYKVMRIVSATNRYYGLLCRVGLTPCLPDADVQEQLRNLDIIWNYLLAAKLAVEMKHQFADGISLYRFAVGLMDKMTNEPTRC